jgi:hypothetical protein
MENGFLKIKAFLLKEFSRTINSGETHKSVITLKITVQIQPCFVRLAADA